MYVLARAYLACDCHRLAHDMFMGAAHVVRGDPAVQAVLHVWATVTAHAGIEAQGLSVGHFGSADALARAGWMGDALVANVDRAESVLLGLASASDVQHEWIGTVCHQVAYSYWLLERADKAEKWIMRGVEACGSVVGEETFRLLLLCVQFIEGHADKVCKVNLHA